ncbi:MAG: S9 family peptidase [Actinomycetota bacterium]
MSQPPTAPREPQTTVVHGDERIDDYFWLRSKDDPRVLDYLKAENAYTDEVMGPTDGLQTLIYSEIIDRIQETDVSAPTRDDPYLYYSRTFEGKQYSTYCRRLNSPGAGEEVLLDENALAEGHDYYSLGIFEVSEDHNLLAYSEDFTGGESYVIRVKDLRTGDLLPDELTGTYYSCEWTNDGTAFYYTTHDDAMRPHKLWLHRLGTAQSTDVCVFTEPDDRFFVGVSKTRSKSFIFISVESQTTSEEWFADASQPGAEFRVIEPRRQELEYSVSHQGDRFLITANDTGRNFRLVEAPVEGPGAENWMELVPHRPDVKLEAVGAYADHLIRYEREGGLPRIVVAPNEGDEHVIEVPDPVYALAPGTNAMYDTTTFRFTYSSLSRPVSQFDYDVVTREPVLVKQQPVLGDFDTENYVTERAFATAPDGVSVPISLVRRKDTPVDGSAPCWLYGYGSYGASMQGFFDSMRLSLLDRGFVFAIAHIRGGGELGKPWHDQGRLEHKRNTFTDFIACAEHLIASNYTSAKKLVIEGGSAGGLLMGAVTNMRPDLFNVVIAHVPFVDCVNTILDASLPLTVTEYEEWGNPSESEEVYRYMLSYSPYDNVESKEYPHLLVIGGFNDPRVHYWEPAKWVAKLRAMKTDQNRLLLKTRLDTGHGGPSGRYDAMREEAFVFTFALDTLDISA